MNDLKGIIEDCNKSDLVSDKVIKKVIEIIGQEEWQILHDENNDVCTTMGELIITLKGITELEKEKCELLGIIQGKDKAIKDLEWQLQEVLKDNDNYQADNERLEKENAELKTDYEVLSCSVGDFDELQEKLEEEQRKNNGLSDNLAKAKEIIKKLCEAIHIWDYKNLEQIEVEAEQFLSCKEILDN